MSAPNEDLFCQKGKAGDAEAIAHLKEKVRQGAQWFISLLEAIGLWCSPQEPFRARRYRYLVGGEAFDWLLLAERLLFEVKGQVPPAEAEALIFSGTPPVALSKEEFKRLIGASKYKAHLNYVYGVIAEEALLMAVEEQVHKERSVGGFEGSDPGDEAFLRVYGSPRDVLLERFRQEMSLPASGSLRLSELREFTYWLFKYRMSTCDPERVASDTRKALAQLGRAGARDLYV